VPKPMRSMLVAEMEVLFASANGNRSVLMQLEAVLKQRSTPSARHLLNKVKSAIANLPTQPSAPPTRTQPPRVVAPTGSSSTGQRPPAAGGVASASQAPIDYELLRKSFTAEAELLARWGMTASIPDDLMERVFSNWVERLTSTPDQWGRTVDSARRDLVKVKEIRRLAKPVEAPAVDRVTSGGGR
jgi:hypothetical protein